MYIMINNVCRWTEKHFVYFTCIRNVNEWMNLFISDIYHTSSVALWLIRMKSFMLFTCEWDGIPLGLETHWVHKGWNNLNYNPGTLWTQRWESSTSIVCDKGITCLRYELNELVWTLRTWYWFLQPSMRTWQCQTIDMWTGMRTHTDKKLNTSRLLV